jgi:hypothetical protein
MFHVLRVMRLSLCGTLLRRRYSVRRLLKSMRLRLDLR